MLGVILIMIIMFLVGFILVMSSILGLIACKTYKKKKGKKANIIIRILLIIILLAGAVLFIIPSVFGISLVNDYNERALHVSTLNVNSYYYTTNYSITQHLEVIQASVSCTEN